MESKYTISLPIPPDATFWYFIGSYYDEIAEGRFDGVFINWDGKPTWTCYGATFTLESLGDTFFLTYEDAEKELNKRKTNEELNKRREESAACRYCIHYDECDTEDTRNHIYNLLHGTKDCFVFNKT